MTPAVSPAPDPARAAFLRRILDDPADDTVRLVFADWLEEHGQPEWAEFIRTQINLARFPEYARCTTCSAVWCPVCGDCTCADREHSMSDPGCPLHDPMNRHARHEVWADRERELFDAANHPGGFLDAFTVGPLTTQWRRGFPFRVTMLATDFVRHAAAIFAAHPITDVTLSDRVPDENVHTAPSWTWWEGEALRDWSGANPTDVPAEVFALIDGTAIIDFGDLRKSFDSPAEAHRALSVACVRLGRSLAGLPALPTTTTETRP